MAISSGFTHSSYYVGTSSDTKPTSNQEIGALFFETDTKILYEWSGSTWVAGGSRSLYLASLLAGEEMADSRANSLVRVSADWKPYTQVNNTNEQVVLAAPCRAGYITVNTAATTTTITLRDSATTGGGSTGIVLNAVVGGVINIQGFRFTNGLTAQCATSGAGVTIWYREAQFT